MSKYYIINPVLKRFEKITEEEHIGLFGTTEVCGYVNDVYTGRIPLENVPEDLRMTVETVVNNRIAKWGKYEDQEVDERTLKTMIEGVM
jgi:hypothetical protein